MAKELLAFSEWVVATAKLFGVDDAELLLNFVTDSSLRYEQVCACRDGKEWALADRYVAEARAGIISSVIYEGMSRFFSDCRFLDFHDISVIRDSVSFMMGCVEGSYEETDC